MLSRVLARCARRPTPPACPDFSGARSGVNANAGGLGGPNNPGRASLPPVLRELAELVGTRPRVVRREILAAQLVAYLREEGFTGWMLPEDIDEVSAWFADREHVEPVPPQLMREALAAVPGVRPVRRRILQDPEFAAIRQRLKFKGKLTTDRLSLFFISAEPPGVMPAVHVESARLRHDQLPAAAAPSNDRASRPEAGRKPGKAVAGAKPAKKHRTIADVRQPCSPAPGQAPTRGDVERQATRRAA